MDSGDPESHFEPLGKPKDPTARPHQSEDNSLPWKWAIGCFGPILLLILLIFAISQCAKQPSAPCLGFPATNTASGVLCGTLP